MHASVLESMREGVNVSDESGIIVYTNPAEDRMFGYEPGELLGRHVTALNSYPPEENERIVGAVIAQLHRTGEWQGEWSNIRKDGTPFTTHARITALVMEGRRHWVCVQEDVTERRRAEAALRESETKLSRIGESGVVGLFFWDVGGRVTDANDAFLDLLGWTRADLEAGRIDWRRMTPDRWREADQAKVRELVATGRHGPYEKEYLSKDGVAVPVLITSAFLADSRERGVCLCIDVAERRRAEARTQALQRLTAALAEVLTPAEVARAAVEEAVAALEATSGVLVLLRPDGASLGVVAALGMPDHVLAAWRSFPLDAQVPIAAAVREREPVVLESLTAHEERFPALGMLAVTSPDPAIAAVPLLVEGRAIGAIGVAYAARRSFSSDDVDFMRAIAGQCAIAVERGRLYEEERAAREEAERAGRRVAFLAAASETLAASLDVDSTLAAVARLAVPELADWSFVELLDDDGQLHTKAIHHADPAKVRLGWEAMARWPINMKNEFGSALVARTGESSLVEDVPAGAFEAIAYDAEHLRLLVETGFRSIVQAPLRIRRAGGGGAGGAGGDGGAGGVERTIGVLSFMTTDESGRRYGAADLALAEEVATRAAAALENGRLYEAERAARADAEAANRAKSDFLAVMSHELRTPLNAIGGYVELLEMGIRGPITETQREDLSRIQRSQKHLLGLINEVLNYARVETGSVRYEIGAVGVAEVLVAVETLIAPQLRAKGLAYRLGGTDPDLAVRADREKLQQVLVNLLSNAVKFTEGGGRVEVSAGRVGERVAIRVRDSGIGIAPEKLESIFEPFVQIDARLTRTGEGVGLGLAISRDLARGMGGEITVESEPGRGSTFTVLLPRAAD